MKHKTFIIRLFVCLLLLEPAARFVFALAVPLPVRAADVDIHEADGYWLTNDYATATLHVFNGVRHTTRQPERYAHTLWLFGNSVTFGLFVSDDDTTASRLQAIAPGWRVVNLSTAGQSVRGQLNWLKHTTIQSGDAVVFMDGFTEMYYADHASQQPFVQDCHKPNSERPIITFYAIACVVAPFISLRDDIIRVSIDDYWIILDAAQRYANAHGAVFVHFIQPGMNLRFPLIGARYTSPGTVALSVSAEDFVDKDTHINAHGAALIARQIFDYLTVY